MRIYIFIMLTTLVMGCLPMRDAIDMAYEGYQKQRGQCQTDSCRQVAAQQFAATVTQASNEWTKWKTPDQWQSVPAVQTSQEVEIYPSPNDQSVQEFTPQLPITFGDQECQSVNSSESVNTKPDNKCIKKSYQGGQCLEENSDVKFNK